MDTYFGSKPTVPRLIDLLREREIRDSKARRLALKRNVTDDLISRLGLEGELTGHQGCVNCLQWSDCGKILASASDDMHIFLWNPFTFQKKSSFHTGHSGNIFSVNFIPRTNNKIIASGAADAKVKVFNIELSQDLHTCTCHTGRVKRIATAKNMPYLFWSAAEDGLILQHDLRMPHICVTDHKQVLLDLVQIVGYNAEAKCMAINAVRPELVAVGVNDPFVRMFDRRMIKPSQPPAETFSAILPTDSAQYFISGHLRSFDREKTRTLAATYVAFSGDGTELLVNMGGEHIYLFDIMRPRHNKLFDVPSISGNDVCEDECKEQLLSSAYGIDSKDTKDYPSMNVKVLPDHVEELKLEANNQFQMEKYAVAINLYNKALGYCPKAAVLYGNRAAAFVKRKWDGDIYAALRDCQTTLLLDPEHIKAHFRLARCLFDLNRPFEAYRVIEDFQKKFSDYTSNAAYRALKKDIVDAIKSNHLKPKPFENLSSYERGWRNQTIDYKFRYCGHCNTTTDIKEANFFGSDGQYIIAGSDDCNIFIWDRYTTNIVRVLEGDSRIVNSLQPHPSSCFLATSGIDPVIRLWSPLPENDKQNKLAIIRTDEVANANQIRMNNDPFSLMLMSIGYNFPGDLGSSEEDTDARDQNSAAILRRSCRPS